MNFLRFLMFLLLTTFSANAATLSGTVRDSEGAVIANAHVIVHWDSSGSSYLSDNVGIKEDLNTKTDANGKFFLDLPSGFYDVFVAATGFSPHCDKIRLKSKDLRLYEIRLTLSKVTFKELDSRFPADRKRSKFEP